MIDLKDKVAVITGAGAGIGGGIAKAYAAVKAQVVVLDVDQDRVAKTCKEIADGGGAAFGAVTDVTHDQRLGETFEVIERQFGQVDILVNNVGGELGGRKPFSQTDARLWTTSINQPEARFSR